MSDIVERLRHSNTAYGWINRQNIEAADEIQSLRQQLADMERKLEAAHGGWISCSDRLPDYMPGRDESPVVFGVCNGKIGLFQRQFVGEGWLWAQANGYCAGDLEKAECEADDDYQVTHWRPMLSLPIGVHHAKG